MPEPIQLMESYDIKLGGGSWYEAYYDCGFTTPIQVVVGQSNRSGGGSRGAPNNKIWRWFGQARLLTAAYLGGQSSELPVLLQLAKSDMSVRTLKSDAGDDEYLSACRDDAQLLAERGAAVLGAVKVDSGKKR